MINTTKKCLITVLILTLPGMVFSQNSRPLDDILKASSDMLAQRQMLEAVELLEAALVNYPASIELHNNLAVAYLGAGRFEDAQTILRDLVDGDPVFRIVAHNMLEFENSEGGTQAIDPLLFVQSAESWYQTEILNGNIPQPSQEPVTLVAAADQPVERARAPSQVDKPGESEIRLMVENWKNAWAAQDLDAYFSYYSEDFQPRDGTTTEWLADRREKIGSPSEIDIQLSNFDISIYTSEIRARFDQRYESPLYRDRVRKLLVIDNTDGEWKIVRESTLQVYEIY